MVNWPDDARKLAEYDSLRAERDKLKAEGVPGVIHEVDRDFYDLAVKERDYAYAQVNRLSRELDKARADERRHTAELRAQVARLEAELAQALSVTVLNVRKSAIMEAMEISTGEEPGTVIRATDQPGLAFVLGEDRTWRRLPAPSAG